MPAAAQLSLYSFDASSAVIAGEYRYVLRRTWDVALPVVLFVMLNPSTADATVDDNTIRKCIKLARRWGYGGLVVVNLFALRSTDPDELLKHPDPIGLHNDSHIMAEAVRAEKVVCAWGSHEAVEQREAHVLELLERAGLRPYCLRVSKGGHPWHPLYIPDASDAFEFDSARIRS